MKTIHILYKALLIAPLLFTTTLFAQTNTDIFPATSAASPLKFDEQPLGYKPDYKTAIGIRAGGTSGLTIKHFFGTSSAVEGIIGLWPNAFGLTGLYEKHVSVNGAPGLKFYYGGGAHITAETNSYYYRYNHRYRDYEYRYGHNGFGIGIDGIVGIEYKIPVIPFAISLDLKPFVEVSNYGGIFTAIDPALGIKVAF